MATNNTKTRVLLLQEVITHYREPIYSMLADEVDLTVGYQKGRVNNNLPFSPLKLETYKIGPFTFVIGLRKLCKSFDVVISMTDPHQFSYCSIVVFHKKYKVIDWNIGVRASYAHRYILPPPNDLYHRMARFFNRRANAVLFYMPQPIEYCVSKSMPREKFYVAYNTVRVLDRPIDWEEKRSHLLFLGTLYPQKRVDELLRAYIAAVENVDDCNKPQLDIIGDGSERETLEQMVKAHNLNKHVVFHGSITDDNVLFELFGDALLCISPDQAGLSVLKSMGYGVPYVTRSNAITGGERFNIIDKENGFFYDSEEELVDIIKLAISKPEVIMKMGRNAFNFYHQNATPEKMVKGFLDAINYAINH